MVEEKGGELENKIVCSNIMPRKRKSKTKNMRGRGTISNLQTANRNIRLANKLLSAKPPLQQPGQLARPVQYGGALRDKFGAYLYIPRS
jgi:hypothetical protein